MKGNLMSFTPAPAGGLCQTDQYARRVLTSEYMEPFDALEYKDLNPHATPLMVSVARTEHNKKAIIAIEEAKRLCNSCPVLDACADWVLNKTNSPISGVVAGMTEKDRWLTKGGTKRSKSKKVSAPHVLDELAIDNEVDVLSMLENMGD